MKVGFIGHFTEDIIKIKKEKFFNIGGGVTYGSLCAKNYWNNYEYFVVSSASNDFLKKLKKFSGINLIITPSNSTTKFFLNYESFPRKLTLINKASQKLLMKLVQETLIYQHLLLNI